jgi:ribosomal RNA-processing protein 7
MPSLLSQSATSAPSPVPSKITDLAVLAVTFAATTAYPHPSTHYLYIRPDAPKDADELSSDNARSLFVANVPVTSSEREFRAFFKSLNSQALVDSVVFASAEKRAVGLGVTGDVIIQGTKIGVPIGTLRGSGKKRKRGVLDEDELVRKKLAEMEVPSTWERDVWESGSSAVVRFVDQASRAVAWKAVQKAAKEGRAGKWPALHEVDEELGMAREYLPYITCSGHRIWTILTQPVKDTSNIMHSPSPTPPSSNPK